MSRRKNKLFFLFIFLLIVSGCSDAVNVEQIHRVPVTQTTYAATVNGEQKEVSIYNHVETINGTDFVVPNPYAEYQGKKFQITVFEEIMEFEGKNYLLPKGQKIVDVTDNEIVTKRPVIFEAASGERQGVTVS